MSSSAQAQRIPTPAEVAAIEVARPASAPRPGPRTMPDDAQWVLNVGASMMVGAGAMAAARPSLGGGCGYPDEEEDPTLRRATYAMLGVGAVLTTAALIRTLVSGGSTQPRRMSRGGRIGLHVLVALVNSAASFSMLLGGLVCSS